MLGRWRSDRHGGRAVRWPYSRACSERIAPSYRSRRARLPRPGGGAWRVVRRAGSLRASARMRAALVRAAIATDPIHCDRARAHHGPPLHCARLSLAAWRTQDLTTLPQLAQMPKTNSPTANDSPTSGRKFSKASLNKHIAKAKKARPPRLPASLRSRVLPSMRLCPCTPLARAMCSWAAHAERDGRLAY